MALQDLPFKSAYDSDTDNALTDFYIPALANSILYDRLTGFFSSTTLAAAAKGIAGLVKNGGTSVNYWCGFPGARHPNN